MFGDIYMTRDWKTRAYTALLETPVINSTWSPLLVVRVVAITKDQVCRDCGMLHCTSAC